ncbi:MAG: ABC transporter permease subunit [Armatimonadota bacterium]|nr:ABC transporter permease subunit [Armatimonadota bacterium]MDR7485661.1 ABC transporter permease subunit [Armatimonadota bacterium]MDR7534302.1 ABC transporter permease subunit [Armatimonadota bacterium]MDR7535914.1 ABC transporter permease subunit [Armatimonadota bacterium]
MSRGRLAYTFAWAYVGCVLLFLYAQLVPPLLFSLGEAGGSPGGISLAAYLEIWRNPVLLGAVRVSAVLGILTATLTPLLALLAAMGVRELRAPRLVLLLVLLPLFIPGVSMGLAVAFFFRLLGVVPSLWTILTVHVLWSLPFAFLIVLTAMATFDPVYLEAAYVHGANRTRAFWDVELPLIYPGIVGAATFSLILSLNETVRTSLVQGPLNTVQTYIWSTYLQVGLSTSLYALMSLLIVSTLVLIVGLRPLIAYRPRPRVSP